MNHKMLPTSDINVRKALAHSFNYDEFIKRVLNGYGLRMRGMIPEGVLGHVDDYPDYPFDLQQAKQFLDQASPEGVPLIEGRWYVDYPDPDNFINAAWTKYWAGPPTNGYGSAFAGARAVLPRSGLHPDGHARPRRAQRLERARILGQGLRVQPDDPSAVLGRDEGIGTGMRIERELLGDWFILGSQSGWRYSLTGVGTSSTSAG